MEIKILAMLTKNDVTIERAQEVFEENKHADIDSWGFKDTGIDTDRARKLVASMKRENKHTYLEPLVTDESECIKAAEFAIECGFDAVIGVKFYESVANILNRNGIKYYPTCGRRDGIPRMLYGTHEEIIQDALRIVSHDGVDGICLSIYRYVDGDPQKMANEFVKRVTAPLIVSGSLNTKERLDFVKTLKPWGFTMGSALFDDSLDGDTMQDKLEFLRKYMEI